jgi:hypothetical protein
MGVILMAFIKSRKSIDGETGKKIFGMQSANEEMKRVESSQLAISDSDKELVVAECSGKPS